MGANILGNLLGMIGKPGDPVFDGACIVQAPIKMWETQATFFSSLGGLYNRKLGQGIKRLMLLHEDTIADAIQEKCGVPLRETFEKMSDRECTVENIDEIFTSKFFGFKDRNDYFDKASCYHRIPKIETPSLFINALDDPIVSKEAIDYEVMKGNPYVAVATTKHGGHLGYNESFYG